MKAQSTIHKALSTTSPHFGPAVGKMLNGTHKYFRRIFCNNYPVHYRETMVAAIEGTPEERRRLAAQEANEHWAALSQLNDLKTKAIAAKDFGSAMMYKNQIEELIEKWKEQHGSQN